ncbi:WD repeat-containing protein 35 [Blyttiomyces sp. JEL0837]|nr:WD repeat-containing protein 35 [Blyttiomyces sp. JEL0837]
MKNIKIKWNNNGSILAVSGVQFARSSQGEEKEVSVVQYTLTVSNAIGTAIETKYIEFMPKTAKITRTHVVAATTDIIICWQYRSTSKKTAAFDAIRRRELFRDRLFHIDDPPEISSGDTNVTLAELKKKKTTDPIVTIAASETMLIVMRHSGALLQFALPSVTLEMKYNINFRPQIVSLNCNSTRLAMLDGTGVLKLFEMTKKSSLIMTPNGGLVGVTGSGGSEEGKLLDFERKDVWDLKWAHDNPDLFAIMEKTRMYIFRNVDPEEPINCTGYICSFDNLQIKAALLDEIFKDPETVTKDLIINIDSKSLRDTRNILSQVGLMEGLQFVEDNPHPRLWKLVADSALDKLDFTVAQKAFVRSLDYKGLQFLKKLQKLNDPHKQRADVLAHFGQYDQAERVYLEQDRKDLAIDLRIQLGDWFRAVQLMKSGGVGDDVMLDKAWNSIGDYYFDRQKWMQALTYYAQGRNTEKLIECYYIVEDFESLEKIVYLLPEHHPLLTLADEAAKKGKNPLRIKKYYVLAALEVERYHYLTKTTRVAAQTETSALDSMLIEDRKSVFEHRFLDNIWRSAEAYHFYLLTQRQFYSGNVSSAMRTALHLRNYEDIIDAKIIYSLLAIVAFHNQHFGVCSSAFIRLESMPNISEEERDTFEALALAIFTK